MNIAVDALRQISSALFDRLEALGHSRVDIRQDYYWEVDRAQRHNLDFEPENLRVGRLTEDWSTLEELLRDDARCVSCGLTQLGSILREIGESLTD